MNLEHLHSKAGDHLKEHRWSEAVQVLKEITDEARRQENLERQYKQATEYFKWKKWEAAIQKFEGIARLESQYRDVGIRLEEARGFYYFEKEEWTKAIKAFRTVLSLDPGREKAKDKLGEAEKQQELDSLYAKALKWEKTEEWKEAYQLYQQIWVSRPGYRDVLDRLAKVEKLCRLTRLHRKADQHLADSQWDAAIKALEQIVELNRQHKMLSWRNRRAINRKLKMTRQKIQEQDAANQLGKGVMEIEPYNPKIALDAKKTAFIILLVIGTLTPQCVNLILEPLPFLEQLWLTVTLLALAIAVYFKTPGENKD
jgi:tetratricopeptide (TPR) repeat protein